jgi:transcriptional regulator with XRE-family HTH domain
MPRLSPVTDNPGGRQPKNPPGPAGERVIAAVKQLRESQGLTYKQLSERLDALGRPIPVLGLSRLEQGNRRVDVDDLVALAIALGTTPNRLLLPPADPENAGDDYRLTATVKGTPPALWAWASGEVPLGQLPARAGDEREARSSEVAFSRKSLPHHWLVQQWSRPASAPLGIGHIVAVAGITTFIAEAVRHLFSTSEVRGITEGAIAAAILSPDPGAEPKVEISEDGRISFRLNGRVIPGEDT